MDIPETYALDRDQVRWPVVFAGLRTAPIALGVLGIAVGLTSVDAGKAVAQRGVPCGLSSFSLFAQSLNIDPNAVRDAAGQAQQSAQQVTPEQAAQAATSARNAA